MRLPQPLLDAVLGLDLELRHRALTVMAVKGQGKTRRRVAFIGEDQRDARFHAGRHQGAR